MGKGRPPDPTRRRRGTGHRQQRDSAVAVVELRPAAAADPGVPGPPAGLPEDARDLWDAVMGELWPRGIKHSDLEGVRMLVTAAHRHRQAAAAVEQHGLLVVGASGQLAANPALRVEKDSAATFLRYAETFGLTLAARLRLGLMQLAGESMLASLTRDLDA